MRRRQRTRPEQECAVQWEVGRRWQSGWHGSWDGAGSRWHSEGHADNMAREIRRWVDEEKDKDHGGTRIQLASRMENKAMGQPSPLVADADSLQEVGRGKRSIQRAERHLQVAQQQQLSPAYGLPTHVGPRAESKCCMIAGALLAGQTQRTLRPRLSLSLRWYL